MNSESVRYLPKFAMNSENVRYLPKFAMNSQVCVNTPNLL